MWMDIRVSSCPVGMCWMALTGGAVGVGGNGVAVSVGWMGVAEGGTVRVSGTVVAEGGTVWVAGMVEGVDVAGMAVACVLQPARIIRMRIIKMGMMDLFVILTSSDQYE
jgi:hypothetical protein